MKQFLVYTIVISLILPLLSFAWDTHAYITSKDIIYYQQKPISITPNLGKVVDQNYSPNASKTIIHLQDLHCNYEVQMNIAAIIKKLHQKHNVALVGLEGAWQNIDVSNLSHFKLAWARRMIGDYLVGLGKYTGAEYYAVTEGQGIQLTGIEHKSLYQKSLKQVRGFLNNEVLGHVIDLRELLVDLKPHLYNQPLLKFDDYKTRYVKDHQDLFSYATALVRLAKLQHIDLASFLNLAIYLNQTPKQAIPPSQLHELEQELSKLDLILRKTLYTHDQQRLLDQKLLQIEIMEKLLNISATPEEVAYYRKNQNKFKLKSFIDFIEHYKELANLYIDSSFLELDIHLQAAADFYQQADQRSHVLAKNLIHQMDKRQLNIAIMISGGFHSKDILNELKSNNINYLSIQPKLTKHETSNPYFDILQGKQAALEHLTLTNRRAGLAPLVQSPQLSSNDIMNLTEQPPSVQNSFILIEALKQLSLTIDGLQPGQNNKFIKWSDNNQKVAVKAEPFSIILSRTPLDRISCEAIFQANNWYIGISQANNFTQLVEYIRQTNTWITFLAKLINAPLQLLNLLWIVLTNLANKVSHWINFPTDPPLVAAGIGPVNVVIPGTSSSKNTSTIMKSEKDNDQTNANPRSASGADNNQMNSQVSPHQPEESLSEKIEKAMPLVNTIMPDKDDVSQLLENWGHIEFIGKIVQKAYGFSSEGAVNVNHARFSSAARRFSRWFLNNLKISTLLIGTDARKQRFGSLPIGSFFHAKSGTIRELILLLEEGADALRPLGKLMAYIITPETKTSVFRALPDFRMFKIVACPDLKFVNWKRILQRSQTNGKVDINTLTRRIFEAFGQSTIEKPKVVILYRDHHQELSEAFAEEMGIVNFDFNALANDIHTLGEKELIGTNGTIVFKNNDDWSSSFAFSTNDRSAPHLIIGEGGMPQTLISVQLAQAQQSPDNKFTVVAMPVPENHNVHTVREEEILTKYGLKPGQVLRQTDLIDSDSAKACLTVFGIYQDITIGRQKFNGPELFGDNRLAITLAWLTPNGLKPIKLIYKTALSPASGNDKPDLLTRLLTYMQFGKWKTGHTIIDSELDNAEKEIFQAFYHGREELDRSTSPEAESAHKALDFFNASYRTILNLEQRTAKAVTGILGNLKNLITQEVIVLAIWLRDHNALHHDTPAAIFYSKMAIDMSAKNGGSYDLWFDHIRLILAPWVKQYEDYLADAHTSLSQTEKLAFLYSLYNQDHDDLQSNLIENNLGDSSPLSVWQFLLFATMFNDFTLNQQALIMDQWREEITDDPDNYIEWTSELISRSQSRYTFTKQVAYMEEDQGQERISMSATDKRRAVTDQSMEFTDLVLSDNKKQEYYSKAWDIVGAQARILMGLDLKEAAKTYYDRWQENLEAGFEESIKSAPGWSNVQILLELADLFYIRYLAFGDPNDRLAAHKIYQKFQSLRILATDLVTKTGRAPKQIENLLEMWRFQMPGEHAPLNHWRPSVWAARKVATQNEPKNANDREFILTDLPEYNTLLQSIPSRAQQISYGLDAFFSFINKEWTTLSQEDEYHRHLHFLYQAWQNASHVEQQALGWAMRLKDLGFYLDPAASGHEERGALVARDVLKRNHVVPEVIDLTERLIKTQSMLGQARLGEILYPTLHRQLAGNRVKFSLVQIMHAMEVVGREGPGNALSLDELTNIVHYHNHAPAARQAFSYRLQSMSSREWSFDPAQKIIANGFNLAEEFGSEEASLTKELDLHVDMVDHIRHLCLDLNDQDPQLYIRLLKLIAQLTRAIKENDPTLEDSDFTFHSDLGNLLKDGRVPNALLNPLITILRDKTNITIADIQQELTTTKAKSIYGLPIYREGNHIWLRFGLINQKRADILEDKYDITQQDFYQNVANVNASRATRMKRAWKFFKAIQNENWDVIPEKSRTLVKQIMLPWFATANAHEQEVFARTIAMHDCGYANVNDLFSGTPPEEYKSPMNHERRGSLFINFYLNARQIAQSVIGATATLTRYHSYLGQVRLGERRESLLLSQALFKANIPFWMLQAINAIDVLAQTDTMDADAINEQLQEIVDYPNHAEEMAQHYGDYRLKTMARASISSPPLTDGTVKDKGNQIEALFETITTLFGEEEIQLRETLDSKVDLLSNNVHLCHAIAATDQKSFHAYVKWMKLLSQLATVIAQDRSSNNIIIRTDIQQIETPHVSLKNILNLATPRLLALLSDANIPNNMTLDDVRTALKEDPNNLFGLPLTIVGEHITLNISKLIETPLNGTPTLSEVLAQRLPVVINSNHWATMLGLLFSARLFDMGLAPTLFIGLGIMAVLVNAIWSNRNQIKQYFNRPVKPIRHHRFRRTMMNAA